MIPPVFLGAILVVGLIALAPTRRLYIGGHSAMTITTYFLTLWLLGIALAVSGGFARILLPVLVILYVLPFITWRRGLDRLRGRPPREVRPPPRNVTPPERDEARTRR
ncbi:MAG: hypothetical protein M3067_11030 [Chloroflexota bacterium]|nr:hypothetical protein [Chloroflexota bacterium]